MTYAPLSPPSTRNVDAVTYDDSSLARNSAAEVLACVRDAGYEARVVGYSGVT